MDDSVKLALVKQEPEVNYFAIQDKVYGERHFVRDGTKFIETTKPPITPIRVHLDRAYTMSDAASFISAVSTYGNQNEGVIFFDEEGVTMFFDQASRKETITLPFNKSLELTTILGNGEGVIFSQKGLLKAVETFPECFTDPTSTIMLANVERFEASKVIEFASDIDPKNLVYTYKEKDGMQTANFPKRILLTLPYFEGSKNMVRVECDFEIVTPKAVDEKLSFRVVNHHHERTKRDAIHTEIEAIKKELSGWLFLFGE